MVLGLVLYFLGIFSLLPAEAGFFSFFEKLLNGDTTEASGLPQDSNSQTIPLLHAALNSDLNTARGGGDIVIVGQTALLAEMGPLGSIADINDATSDQISIYVVQEGDSLTQIAEMFSVSVNTIVWANNLNRGDIINEGQRLIILPVSGVSYKVKNGDTLAGIAKKWNGDVDEIIRFNDLTPGQPLVVGTTIIIPNGETAIPASTVSGSRYRAEANSTKGYYIRPIIGGHKSQGLHGYNAVDLANVCGTPIMASASGDVIVSRTGGWNGGYGNFIIISHPNGTQTLYSHTSSNIVGPGWHVVQGQVIGYIGVTGNTTGCHVHFEVRGAKNPF